VRERLLAEGLPTATDVTATAALTRVLIQVLGRRDDAARASAAAEIAQQVFEASLRRHPPRARIACAKGCAHCCRSNFVGASIPEIVLQARRIREAWPDPAGELRQRIDAAAFRTPDHGEASRVVPCPVLGGDGACGAYDARPLACRGYVSVAVEACIRMLSDPKVEIPSTRPHVFFRTRCTTALWAALKANGLPYASYHLHQALGVAVAAGDAEARWLAGDDVFAGVRVDNTRKPEVEAFLDTLIGVSALGNS
jgi:hypothetical protein